ncbi:MAG TPA: hypothetical protein PKY56_04060 [Candidatus Kapabacteria bacterium]|nr:hypothetical protein [Candidatus Kapabacteria bacterium]
MKTNYEEYRDKQLENPEFRLKYLLAKEKLNLELLLDSINDAVEKQSSPQTLKRRIIKMRKHIVALSI